MMDIETIEVVTDDDSCGDTTIDLVNRQEEVC